MFLPNCLNCVLWYCVLGYCEVRECTLKCFLGLIELHDCMYLLLNMLGLIIQLIFVKGETLSKFCLINLLFSNKNKLI